LGESIALIIGVMTPRCAWVKMRGSCSHYIKAAVLGPIAPLYDADISGGIMVNGVAPGSPGLPDDIGPKIAFKTKIVSAKSIYRENDNA